VFVLQERIGKNEKWMTASEVMKPLTVLFIEINQLESLKGRVFSKITGY